MFVRMTHANDHLSIPGTGHVGYYKNDRDGDMASPDAERIAKLETHMEYVRESMGRIEKSFERIDARFTKVEGDLSDIKTTLAKQPGAWELRALVIATALGLAGVSATVGVTAIFAFAR